MSKISLQPNASGNGTFSIVAPDSNTNRTLTLPDESGAVLSDVSDIAADKLTGDIADDRMKDGFNASGSAPVFACRAWVNFDGTGTVSIRDSGNVSSVTDVGTGLYEVNFTTGMPDNNYVVVGDATSVGLVFPRVFGAGGGDADRFDSSGFGVTTLRPGTETLEDMERIKSAIFR